MSQDINLSTFPSTRSEALTMLYLQSQDLSNKTPGEIVELYFSVLAGVKETTRGINPNKVTVLK